MSKIKNKNLGQQKHLLTFLKISFSSFITTFPILKEYWTGKLETSHKRKATCFIRAIKWDIEKKMQEKNWLKLKTFSTVEKKEITVIKGNF